MLEDLALAAVQVTEAAAIAAYNSFGKGDEKGADKLAVTAMREALSKINIQGVVVIGEGERDQSAMLYIGEKVGNGKGREIDIAVDPLEGTSLLATGRNDALAVIAMTDKGGFLHAPDVYMEKIAIGFNYPQQILDLDNSPAANLKNIAEAKNCNIAELTVVILDRPRHHDLITKVLATGARVRLIRDGDVSAIIETSLPQSKADVYMGIGGAPEGVLAAAALCSTGGQIHARLILETKEEQEKALKMGIKDFNKKYVLEDLASGRVIFAATGVTDGSLLKGVNKAGNIVTTNTLLMISSLPIIRKIETCQPIIS